MGPRTKPQKLPIRKNIGPAEQPNSNSDPTGSAQPPCCSSMQSIWSWSSSSNDVGVSSAPTREPSRRNRKAATLTPFREAYVVNTFSIRVVFFTLKNVSSPVCCETGRSEGSWPTTNIVQSNKTDKKYVPIVHAFRQFVPHGIPHALVDEGERIAKVRPGLR